MGDSGPGWWLASDRTWRKGTPPPGWHQTSDGRWHPPTAARGPATAHLAPTDAGGNSADAIRTLADASEAPTERIPVVAGDSPPRHGADPRRSRRAPEPAAGVAPWRRIAVPAVAAVLALGTAGLMVLRSGGSHGHDAPDAPATSTTRPPTTARGSVATQPSRPESTTTSTSSSPATVPSSEPPPTTSPGGSADPLALCTAAERALIERANHPWSWYVARFDRDGNGILCD